MATSRRDVEVAPGVTFSPQHKDLTDLYLRRKIAGEPLPAATSRFIHEADVYSAEPEQLASAFEKAPGTGKGHGVHKQPVWYFFSRVRHPGGRKKNARGGATRKPRTIDGAVGKHWHSEHSAKPVNGGSAMGGYVQDFSYMVKDSESGKNVRAGWIMYEYGISEEHGGGDLVLCKILPSDPTINSKRKRKAAACGHPEDTTASARPRRTVDQDQHPPPAESLGAATTTEDADDYHHHSSADENQLDATGLNKLQPHMASEEGVDGCYGGDPDTAVAQLFFDNVDGLYQNNSVMVGPGGHLAMAPAAQPEVQEMDGSAPPPLPSNFFHNVEQEFPSLYHNEDIVMVGPGDDLAALPAAQPDEQATGLVQSITADRNNQHHQMEEGTQPEPQEPSADEIIYGLPCPAFSPEMIRMCSMMPWPPSPTSMAAILSDL